MAKANTPATRQQQPGPPAQVAPPARPPKTIRDILEECVDRIATVLPKHLTPDRMISLVSNIVYRTPRLQECDPYSIVSSVQQASALGLDLMPTMGEAYLVPVWNKKLNNGHGGYECQFRPGYQGLAKLARNAGVVYIKAILVRAADIFDHRYTPDLVFLHVPHRGPDRGDICDVYCVAKLPTGEHLIEVMNTDEIEAIHRRSESFIYASKNDKAEFGPWVSDWGEMAKKTVLKRLTKSLPKSPELAEAIEADNRDFPDDPSPARIGARLPARRGVAGLRQQLELDEPTLPPQGTRTYSEYEEPEANEEALAAAVEDQGGTEGAGDDAREG